MRGSMVRELYYGNLSPWERKRVYPPERIALTDKIGLVERYDRLRAGPNEVQAGSLQNNIRCGRISLPLFQKEVYWEAPICPTALPKLSQQVHTHMEKGVKELQREGIDVLMINNNDNLEENVQKIVSYIVANWRTK